MHHLDDDTKNWVVRRLLPLQQDMCCSENVMISVDFHGPQPLRLPCFFREIRCGGRGHVYSRGESSGRVCQRLPSQQVPSNVSRRVSFAVARRGCACEGIFIVVNDFNVNLKPAVSARSGERSCQALDLVWRPSVLVHWVDWTAECRRTRKRRPLVLANRPPQTPEEFHNARNRLPDRSENHQPTNLTRTPVRVLRLLQIRNI